MCASILASIASPTRAARFGRRNRARTSGFRTDPFVRRTIHIQICVRHRLGVFNEFLSANVALRTDFSTEKHVRRGLSAASTPYRCEGLP